MAQAPGSITRQVKRILKDAGIPAESVTTRQCTDSTDPERRRQIWHTTVFEGRGGMERLELIASALCSHAISVHVSDMWFVSVTFPIEES